MTFEKILKLINTLIPLVTVVVSGCFIPSILDYWKYRKLRGCYNSLVSYFDKFCRSLGGISFCTFRETHFANDAEMESLITADKDKPALTDAKNWLNTHFSQVITNLNVARTTLGLESGKFYFSRHFIGSCSAELLVILTVSSNTATLQAFCRGEWTFPKRKKKSKLYRMRVRLFGYPRNDYSIMLV